MLFEKVKASARKPEIGELKPPRKRKFSNHYEEGETLPEFVSTFEQLIWLSPVFVIGFSKKIPFKLFRQ